MTDWAIGIVKHCSDSMLIDIIHELVERIGIGIIINESENQYYLLSIRDGFNFLFNWSDS